MCRSKHVEQLENTGIINSTTRSHLVSYFYRNYRFVYCLKVSQFDYTLNSCPPLPHLRTDMHIEIVMAIPTSTLITRTVLLSKSLVLKPTMTIVIAADDSSTVMYFVS